MTRKFKLNHKENFLLTIYLSCATKLRDEGRKISDHGMMSEAVKDMQAYILDKHSIERQDYSDWGLPVQNRVITQTINALADKGCPLASVYMQIMNLSLPYIENALPETDEYMQYPGKGL